MKKLMGIQRRVIMVMKFIHTFFVITFFTGSIHAATAAPTAPQRKPTLFEFFKLNPLAINADENVSLRRQCVDKLLPFFLNDFYTSCSRQLAIPSPVTYTDGTKRKTVYYKVEPLPTTETVIDAYFTPGGHYIVGKIRRKLNDEIYFLQYRSTLEVVTSRDYANLEGRVIADAESLRAAGQPVSDPTLPPLRRTLPEGPHAASFRDDPTPQLIKIDRENGIKITIRNGRLYLDYLNEAAMRGMIERFSLQQQLFLLFLIQNCKKAAVTDLNHLPIGRGETSDCLHALPREVQKYLIDRFKIKGRINDIDTDDEAISELSSDIEGEDLMSAGTSEHHRHRETDGFSPLPEGESATDALSADSTYTTLTSGRGAAEAPSGDGAASAGAGGSAPSRDGTY